MRISDWSSDVCSSDLFGEGFGHHALGRAVHPHIGDGVEPGDELGVEVLHIAEGSPQEEVLAYVAERPLYLPLRFGAIGAACPGLEPIVLRQGQQRAVVDDVPLIVLTCHGGLHPVRSEEHTSELQSLMRISYAVFCLKKKKIDIIL